LREVSRENLRLPYVEYKHLQVEGVISTFWLESLLLYVMEKADSGNLEEYIEIQVGMRKSRIL
jgi:hypothetical protein